MPSKPEVIANELLTRFKVGSIPVPVEDMVRGLGVQLRFVPLDSDVSAMLFRREDAAVIGVNSAHPRTRQRFSLGHEIGHLLMHKGKEMVVDRMTRVNLRDRLSSLATDAEEIEANAFGASLLMPASIVRSELQKLVGGAGSGLDDEIVESMARRFDVSAQAMSFRLVNLGFRLPE